MADTGKTIENLDTPSPRKEDREKDAQEWDEEQGKRIASEQGIHLTDEHWEVIHRLREYHVEHGPADNGREVGDMLEASFAEQGGRRYLRKLFPEGPVRQGMMIAGLQVPAYTEDEGFGTSR